MKDLFGLVSSLISKSSKKEPTKYDSLISYGFGHDLAEKITGSHITVSMAEALRPSRLTTLDDVDKLTRMPAQAKYDPQSYWNGHLGKDFEHLARERGFTLDELIGLRYIPNDSIGLEDVEGYEQLGISTPSAMLEAFHEGLTRGHEIPGYFARDISDPETITTLQHGGAYLVKIDDYREHGVNDGKDIAALNLVYLKPDEIPLYRTAGIEKYEDMITLKVHNVNGKDALNFARAGFEGDKDSMIELTEYKFKDGVSSSEAVGYAEEGFNGNKEAMKQLRYPDKGTPIFPKHVQGFTRAGFYQDEKAMIELTKEWSTTDEAVSNAIGYAEGGLHGNKEAMLTLRKERISPNYVQAQVLLMDGNKPASQEDLLDTIVSMYKPQTAATSPPSA